VYQGLEKVTPERWKSLIQYVEEKVEDHYWEADGLNEELLERFIITNSSSDSESSDDDDEDDDGDGNDGFLDADSTSFGSRSESSADSSDEGRNHTI